MGSLKEESQAYEPTTMGNITDLDFVDIDAVQIKETEKTNDEGKTYTVKYFTLEGKDYRVPFTVFEEIQKMLKLKPDLKKVKVTKSGEGIKTRYSTEAIL